MAIKAVLFDFGGVLVLSQEYPRRDAWEEKLGLEPGELAQLVFNSEITMRAAMGHMSVEEMWRLIGESLGLDGEEHLQLLRDFFYGERLNEELITFARSLKPDYRVAILSNAWSNARRVFSEDYGLDKVFDPLVISAEVGLIKPDPRIYHHAVKEVGVRPEEAAFLDDSLANVEAAREEGLCAIHYQDNAQAIAELKACLGMM